MSSAGARSDRALRGAFTLVELLVVLTILVVVAGLVITSVGGVMASSREDVTKVAFANIRAAIFGERGRGYYADVRAMPTRIADLFRCPSNLVRAASPGPVWRGPYLSPQYGSYLIDVDDGFTAEYGASGDPVPRDGWDRPIVLQIASLHARLVSAGRNEVIDTPSATPDALGDDLVFYLRRSNE